MCVEPLAIVAQSASTSTRWTASSRRGWLILLHHHLVEYPIPSLGLKERIGVALVNAPDVLKAMASSRSPIIVLHGGFKPNFWGGALTQVIMWVFVAVWVSGIVGLILQQIMPTRLLNNVPMETIYEQIDNIIAQLRTEAEQIVKSVEEKVAEDPYEYDAVPVGAATAVAPARTGTDAETKLTTFYNVQVVPVLADHMPKTATLARDRAAASAFLQLRD